MSRYSVNRIVNFDKTEVACDICSKICKGERSLKSHKTQVHSGDKDTSNRGRPKGITAWNKGLTKETSESVKKYGESNKGRPSTFLGRTHSDEAKKKISEKLSANNKGGRCKWYDVNGTKVQGTWERDIAQKLTELNVQWLKCKGAHSLSYLMDDKTRTYTPDFYLPAFDVYLEVKGHWWGRDKEKMVAVTQGNPDKKIVVIMKEEFKKIMDGELVW